MKSVITVLLLLFSFNLLAAPKAAVVKMLRGKAESAIQGKWTALKVNDWVEEGATLKTAEKSFVKLIFIDKSQINLGPSSEMKIEKFSNNEAGVIDFVKGKVRSQVTKDYLQMDPNKSKLFIKTTNAVMGVRGTDFMVTTNGKNTATVLFEGEIVMNHLAERTASSSQKLEEIVDRGVRIMPGEFSVVEQGRTQPTVPAVLNLQQREALESNQNFESNRSPSSETKEEPAARSVVPEGLSGESVSNTSETLKTEIVEVAVVEPSKPASSNDAQGFVSGDKVRPANGSFVHLDSGVVIPPPADSLFDPNTKTFIPSSANGRVSTDGNFIPPKNVEITTEGRVLMTVPSKGGTKVVELSKPAPVVAPATVSLSQAVLIVTTNPTIITNSGTVTINQPPSVTTTLPPATIAPPPTASTDPSTNAIQRANGRLNINVIRN
jgi:hypothetical protein